MTLETPARIPFAELLSPLTGDDFFSHHHEKTPLHISRSDNTHFAGLLSIEKIDQLLSSGEHYFPGIQLTQSSQPVSPLEYAQSNDKINIRRLIQRHHAGATIVISQADKHLSELAGFTRRMQGDFQLLCQTNVYLSPPGKQGFNPHYDSHDVFILQVSGSKTFNFYSGGIDLPLSNHQFDSEKTSAGELTESTHLQAGDTLYIPRGVLHDAVAHDDTSLHITLGVYNITVLQLLQETLQVAAEKQLAYRQSLPPALWRHTSGDCNFTDTASALLAGAVDPDYRHTALARLRDGIALETVPDSTGLLSVPPQADDLSLQSSIAVLNHRILSVERRESTLLLRLYGSIVQLEEPMTSATQWLLGQTQTTIEQLPGLDDEQKFALITHLLQENLLTVTAPD